MNWFNILFLCLMIFVQESNCDEVLNRFRREHQIDDCLKKNVKEKSVIIDQNIAKPDVLLQNRTREIEESNTTEVPAPAVALTKNKKKVVKISNEKKEQRIKASIQKLPPSHPLSRAIKMILDEKENEPHDDLKGNKVVDNIVKSNNQGQKTKNPVNELKRDVKEKLLKSSDTITILKNPLNDIDEKFECDNLNVLSKDLEDKENDHQNTSTVRNLKQKEVDISDGLEKNYKKYFQKKEENSDTKTAETTDEKDKDTMTVIKLKKPQEKGKPQQIEARKSHDLDSKTSIDCEDHEYEETYIETPPPISDLPISQTLYHGAMNWNQLPYYKYMPKPYDNNYYMQNYGPSPYSNIMVQGGTILNSPNHYQQQCADSFPANNITPYQDTYNSCPVPYHFNNKFNINDVIRRAWKNRVIHVDNAGIKDQGDILNTIAPRTIGSWQRPQVNDDGNTKIIHDKTIQETNGIIIADKNIPSFLIPKQPNIENANSVQERARRPNNFIARNGCYWNYVLPHQINSYAR